MEEESYRYRYNTAWINTSQLLDGYHIATFQYMSHKPSNDIDIDDIVDLIFLPVIGVLGILGNISGIVCFSKKLHLTYYSLLLSLVISDLITILAFILYYTVPRLFNQYSILECSIFPYLILFAYYLLHLSQLIDIYLLVALSFDRFLAICHPISYRSRKISIFCYIIPIIIFSICYCIPILFEYYVDNWQFEKYRIQGENLEFVHNATVYLLKHTDLKLSNSHYTILYETIGKLIVKCVVPYLLLMSTNALILRDFFALKYTHRREDSSNSIEDDTAEKKQKETRYVFI